MTNDPKVEVPVKRRPGRPLGSKTKKQELPPSRIRLRDVVARAYTPEQLEKILKRLSPDQAARLLTSLEPKMKEEVTATTFRLVIEGLNRACTKCGFKPEPAPCAKCGHMETQPEALQSTISPPATQETDLSGGPKPYVPDPDALKRLAAARGEELPGAWYEGPDDFDPEKET